MLSAACWVCYQDLSNKLRDHCSAVLMSFKGGCKQRLALHVLHSNLPPPRPHPARSSRFTVWRWTGLECGRSRSPRDVFLVSPLPRFSRYNRLDLRCRGPLLRLGRLRMLEGCGSKESILPLVFLGIFAASAERKFPSAGSRTVRRPARDTNRRNAAISQRGGGRPGCIHCVTYWHSL